MKNRFLCALLTLVIIVGTFTIPIMAEDNIKVLLNGTELTFDVPPQIINGRTMLPMRKIFEALGAEVKWVEEIQTIYAHLSPRLISLKIDDPKMYIMDASLIGSEQSQWIISLDVPPQLIDSRTLVPVRAVAEGLNADVQWDGDKKTVIITKGEKPVVAPTPTVRPLGFNEPKISDGCRLQKPSIWKLQGGRI